MTDLPDWCPEVITDRDGDVWRVVDVRPGKKGERVASGPKDRAGIHTMAHEGPDLGPSVIVEPMTADDLTGEDIEQARDSPSTLYENVKEVFEGIFGNDMNIDLSELPEPPIEDEDGNLYEYDRVGAPKAGEYHLVRGGKVKQATFDHGRVYCVILKPVEPDTNELEETTTMSDWDDDGERLTRHVYENWEVEKLQDGPGDTRMARIVYDAEPYLVLWDGEWGPDGVPACVWRCSKPWLEHSFVFTPEAHFGYDSMSREEDEWHTFGDGASVSGWQVAVAVAKLHFDAHDADDNRPE